MPLSISNHPLVKHKLGLLRRRDTPPWLFRPLVRELTLLLLYEATADLALRCERIETPLARIIHDGVVSESLLRYGRVVQRLDRTQEAYACSILPQQRSPSLPRQTVRSRRLSMAVA